MTQCPTLFCKCLLVNNIFDQNKQIQPFQLSVLFSIFYILIIIMLIIKLSLSWFISKDYYPLKQRSPILCMLLIAVIGIQLLLYPVLYVLNFYTMNFSLRFIKLTYRSIHTGLEFTPYFIYLIRSLRIVYAHKSLNIRRKEMGFKIFHNQVILATSIFIASLLRALPVIADNFKDDQSHFMLMVEYSGPQLPRSQQIMYFYHYFIASFIWKLIFVYCLYMQRYVHKMHSMKVQLIVVIIIESLSWIPMIIIALSTDGLSFGTFNEMCHLVEFYPLTEIIKSIRLFLLLGISIVFPLRKRKLYHRLLPTGRVFGFVKTMRDFLIQDFFLKIFQKFMVFLDQQHETTYYSSLITFWKNLIVIKYKQNQLQTQKLSSIKSLLSQYEQLLFQDSKKLILALKASIDSLQSAINENNESLVLDPMKTSFSNVHFGNINSRHRIQINIKVDELEKLILNKIDKVYVQMFMQTKSYQALKIITRKNKKINLNMVMLNMALIVDSVHTQYQ